MRRFSIVLALVSLVCHGFAQQPKALQLSVPAAFQLVVYGDIRFTNPSKTGPSNPQFRQALVRQVASLKPSFLLISGDLVLEGSNAADWAVWDSETKPWSDENLPLFPTIGNHELYDTPSVGLRNYFQRFPALENSRYYSLLAGNTLTLVLDSSQDEVDGAQGQWLADQLDHLPAGVDFVLFLLHHPPYTNSSDSLLRGGHSPRPSEQALAKMLEARQLKTRPHFIVFSGHVHNYERYEHHGVTYIVTGGGGATPYPIPRRPDDAYHDPGPTYHYCLLDVNGSKLEISMMKLELRNGQPSFTRRDSVVIISAPSAAKSAAAK